MFQNVKLNYGLTAAGEKYRATSFVWAFMTLLSCSSWGRQEHCLPEWLEGDSLSLGQLHLLAMVSSRASIPLIPSLLDVGGLLSEARLFVIRCGMSPLEKNSWPRLLVSRLEPRVQRTMCWCLAAGCLAPSARCLAWSARCWCRTAWGLGDPASYTQDSSPAACTLHHTLRLPPGNQWIIYCTVDVFEGLSNGIHSFSSTKWIFKSEAYPSYSGWIILNVLMPVKDFLKQRKIEIHLSQRRGILMSHRMAEVAREHGWPKSWARTKILSPNIHYFVAN